MAYKFYGMKSFQLPGGITAGCKAQGTSYGFRHLATLRKGYQEVGSGKATYYNRTWEAFEYQTAIDHAVNGADITDAERIACKEWLNTYQEASPFNSVLMVSALGDLLNPDQSARNDWKKRMMQAGLPGIDVPEDWESLSEDEKTRRIDGALNQLN